MPTTPASVSNPDRRAEDQRLPIDVSDSAPGGGTIAIVLATVWFVCLLAGMIVLRVPGATIAGNELSIERAVFSATNAATLTGFQQARSIDDLASLGKSCLISLTVIATLASWMIGGLGLVRLLRWPITAGRIVGTSIIVYLFAVAWGTAVLLRVGQPMGDSAFLAASALGNSGLFMGHLPAMTDWRTMAGLLPLAVVGGLSIPVLMEVGNACLARGKISKHSLVVLGLLAGVYIAGVGLLGPWWQHADSSMNWQSSLAAGSAMSIDSRSTGFGFLPISSLIRPQQWLLILFMLIGAAPGSAAGGLHVTSIYHFFHGIRRALKRQTGLRITGIAGAWIGIYLLLVLATLLALLGTAPEMPADRLVFLAASAVGAVGLAHEPVTLTGAALYILTAAMFIGRVAPLAVLWWAARTCDDADVAV